MIGIAKAFARRLVVVALVAAVAAAIARPVFAKPTPGYENATPASVRPDDRAGVRGPGGAVAQSRVLRIVTPVTRTSSSFHWDDALIGALVASGAAVLLVLTALGVRRHLVSTAPLSTSMERSVS
ncbi:MAG TPA: hypothetical protein VLB89_05990 [Gaiellaceae bacterium]|nr:hypothetical protein [Gaiellaceae bacterium]